MRIDTMADVHQTITGRIHISIAFDDHWQEKVKLVNYAKQWIEEPWYAHRKFIDRVV